MSNFSVIRAGNKQYIVKEGDTLNTERLAAEKEADFEVLMTFNDETHAVEVGKPMLDKKQSASIVEHFKGEKVRVAKFKAKVRYRKVRGFRPALTKIKIG